MPENRSQFFSRWSGVFSYWSAWNNRPAYVEEFRRLVRRFLAENGK
jgi:hypothetical protein